MSQPQPESNAPSYACSIWFDRDGIYVELASGLITKFDFTGTGLSKILKLLEKESRPTSKPTKERLPFKPTRRRPSKTPPKPVEVTVSGKASALSVLKRKGLV